MEDENFFEKCRTCQHCHTKNDDDYVYSYWIPQGWYEVCDYFEDYSYSEILDKVTAWMKLPKPYEPRLKEFGGGECDGMES